MSDERRVHAAAAFYSAFVAHCSLLLLAVPRAQAATYYVAKTGSDSNTCAQAQSPSTPFATISKPINGNPCNLVGGDTIEVRANSLGGSATFSDQFDCNVNSSQCIPGGTSWASPVVVRARSGDMIIVQPTGGGRIFSFDNANQQYIEINGFIMD